MSPCRTPTGGLVSRDRARVSNVTQLITDEGFAYLHKEVVVFVLFIWPKLTSARVSLLRRFMFLGCTLNEVHSSRPDTPKEIDHP